MDNLKVANKCACCKRQCKMHIINGDVQYCPDYINIESKKDLFTYKRKSKFTIRHELVKA
ncbi:hypothetical protein [Anaeromicrobium sediminis]|uniref:Uncharacterized protein n=1 Tax=Anaeromicrobium sediminis TaxID=1478221 RepID=A0A267MGZ8_9FIRM|nr:hypothetical protein [Anaeromicrobium sediminis]PAB58063.1 hypothetical protein CCE28_17155 [Anaeromicrobium sediminis]